MNERTIVTLVLAAGTIITASVANLVVAKHDKKKLLNAAPEIPTDGSPEQTPQPESQQIAPNYAQVAAQGAVNVAQQAAQYVNGVATEAAQNILQPNFQQMGEPMLVDAAGRPIKQPVQFVPQGV